MSRHFSEEREIPRLEIFIDAILAIIITILVLEFKVPEKAFSSEQEIKSFIGHLVPSFFSYGISFATIVSLWIDHHFLFRMLDKADIRFTFFNFVFILFLSPIPFTTALAGRNYESAFAVALVATNYFLMNLSFSFIWRYATTKKLVRQSWIKEKYFKRDVMITISGSSLLLISIPLAYVSTYISFTLFIVVILMHIAKQFFR
jgi:TMEM175 potassium channel family protein